MTKKCNDCGYEKDLGKICENCDKWVCNDDIKEHQDAEHDTYMDYKEALKKEK
jgi:methionyl-tRNA synthetase